MRGSSLLVLFCAAANAAKLEMNFMAVGEAAGESNGGMMAVMLLAAKGVCLLLSYVSYVTPPPPSGAAFCIRSKITQPTCPQKSIPILNVNQIAWWRI